MPLPPDPFIYPELIGINYDNCEILEDFPNLDEIKYQFSLGTAHLFHANSNNMLRNYKGQSTNQSNANLWLPSFGELLGTAVNTFKKSPTKTTFGAGLALLPILAYFRGTPTGNIGYISITAFLSLFGALGLYREADKKFSEQLTKTTSSDPNDIEITEFIDLTDQLKSVKVDGFEIDTDTAESLTQKLFKSTRILLNRAETHQQREAIFQGLHTTTQFTGSLIRRANPELANKTELFGSATIQIVKQGQNIRNLIKIGAPWLSLLGPISTIGQTILSIYDYFAHSGQATMQQVIEEQFTFLVEEVRSIRLLIEERFDKFENILAIYHFQVMDGFTKISAQLQNIQQFCLTQFKTINDKLESIEKLTLAIAGQQQRIQLTRLIHSAKEQSSQRREGMKEDKYWYYISEFKIWAIHLSKNKIATGQPLINVAFSNTDVISTLNTKNDFEVGLGFFIEYLEYHRFINFGSSCLVNLDIWADSCDAYINLRRDHPSFESEYTRPYQDIINLKEPVEELIRAIQSLQQNPNCFIKIIQRYEVIINKLSQLDTQSLQQKINADVYPNNDSDLQQLESSWLLLYYYVRFIYSHSFQSDVYLQAFFMLDSSAEFHPLQLPTRVRLKTYINKLNSDPTILPKTTEWLKATLFAQIKQTIAVFKRAIEYKNSAISNNVAQDLPQIVCFMLAKLNAFGRKLSPKNPAFIKTISPMPVLLDLMSLSKLDIQFSTQISNLDEIDRLIELDKTIIETCDEVGRNLLMLNLSVNPDVEVVLYFLSLGISPEHIDKFNNNALHYAIYYQAPIEIISILIEAGVPSTDTNAEGLSPRDIAIKGGNLDLIKILNKYQFPVLNYKNLLSQYAFHPTHSHESLFCIIALSSNLLCIVLSQVGRVNNNQYRERTSRLRFFDPITRTYQNDFTVLNLPPIVRLLELGNGDLLLIHQDYSLRILDISQKTIIKTLDGFDIIRDKNQSEDQEFIQSWLKNPSSLRIDAKPVLLHNNRVALTVAIGANNLSDTTIHIWDINRSFLEVSILCGPCNIPDMVSTDNNQLIFPLNSKVTESHIAVWDFNSKTFISRILPEEAGYPTYCVDILSDGSLIAVGGACSDKLQQSTICRIFNLETNSCLKKFNIPGIYGKLLPDENILVCRYNEHNSQYDGLACLYDIHEGRSKYQFGQNKFFTNDNALFAILPNGQIAIASRNKQMTHNLLIFNFPVLSKNIDNVSSKLSNTPDYRQFSF